jgi:hypothetical protein
VQQLAALEKNGSTVSAINKKGELFVVECFLLAFIIT